MTLKSIPTEYEIRIKQKSEIDAKLTALDIRVFNRLEALENTLFPKSKNK